MNTLTIEDEDGFRTDWPWPEDKSLLHNASFVEMCEMQHDAMRLQWERGRRSVTP